MSNRWIFVQLCFVNPCLCLLFVMFVVQVRKKRFFLDSNPLNLASLFVVDLFGTGFKPKSFILLRFNVTVED